MGLREGGGPGRSRARVGRGDGRVEALAPGGRDRLRPGLPADRQVGQGRPPADAFGLRRAGGEAVLSPARWAENACHQGREGGIQGPRRGWAPSIWEMSGKMLETIAVILIVLWLAGFVTSYTMGGLIHLLLVIAIVVILVRVIQGRRPLG